MRDTIENIVSLTPMQEGMLFHTLATAEEGMYVQQLVLRIAGELKIETFERAWSHVVARHQALRSAFVWESVEKPLQVVFRQATLPSRSEDFRGEPEAAREARLGELVEADRHQGFDLRRPPLLRLTFVRMGDRDYRFIFTYHHVLLDGWSGSIVFKEVLALYEAYCRGASLQLPPPVGLTPYAEWARSRTLGDPEAFFRTYLAGLRAPTPLYQDRRGRRASSGESGFAVRETSLPMADTTRLGEFAKAHRLTPSTLLQGAWAALLSRYSGERDVLFGAVSSGRPADLAGMDQMVGMFINTMPARVRIEPDDRLVPWLHRLQREMAELRQYDHVPLVKIHPWSSIPPGAPLFETCEVWESVALDVMRPFSVGDLEFTMEQYSARTSDPITLLAFPGAQLRLQLIFNRSRVAPETAERMLRHLEVWLAAAPRDSERPVVEIPLVDGAEEQALVAAGAGPEKVLPLVTVPELFAAQAARTPDAPAVEDDDTAYTYRQLDERANRIANALRRSGARQGTRVGICLARGAEMVATVLGVMKSGAAYVPLDPAFPKARLSFIAGDARLTALVTAEGCLEELPLPDAQVLFLDRDRDRLAEESPIAPADQVQPDDVAYVLHTSGSTGTPKGVQVPHRALLNFLLGMQELPAVQPSDVLLAVTSLSFDIAGLEIFAPLVAGARLVVAPQSAVADGTALRDWLDRSRATVMQATPATWRMLLAAGWRPGRRLRILTGGEALSPDLARQLCAAGGEVWNLYGPTETTIWSTAWRVDPSREEMSIGRPILNTQLHVVDAAGQPVPVGVVGELLIGGLGVALGYFERPALTAERFVELPVTGFSRVYRTGDLVRWREDGTLDMVGRSDGQVKIRGHRVELGEIEAALNEQPLVRHAAVSIVADASGEQSVVGYIVAEVPEALQQASELDDEHRSDWQRAWDDAYGDGVPDESGVEPTFNTRGWNSSYDGRAIPAGQMREWVDTTAERIRSLRPRRVLEIGCGTGMLLFRLAPSSEAYVGVDFSRRGLESIAANLDALGVDRRRVSLLERDATDLDSIADGSMDTVIVNSVLQYFPSVARVLDVLGGAIRKLGPRGRLFIGDVRDLSLHAPFLTSVQMFNAETETASRALREQVERSLASEKELLLHPGFFTALVGSLPRVASAQVRLKRGRASSEMVRFRYDVVLQLDGADEWSAAPSTPAVEWGASGMALTALDDLLSTGGASGLVVRAIPNRRIMRDVLAARWVRQEGFDGTVDALARKAAARSAQAVDPEDVWAMAEKHGLSAELAPSTESDGCFDASFRRASASVARPGSAGVSSALARARKSAARPWHEYGNNPLQGRLGNQLAPALRRALGEKLPDYMVPSAIVILDALPLTPNGKVDRRALPHPERGAATRSKTYLPPRDALELQLVRIWEDVLGVAPIGVHDDFFDLGGHSLVAVRLAAQVEKRLGRRLSLSSIGDARTVEALARRLRATDLGRPDEVLICLQAGGKKPPLFCVHPAGGSVLCYRDLARALGPEYPVFGFEAALDAEGAIRDRTVDAMTTAYVDAMRRAQPKGPYRLAGWSLGGLVAAEMAERLRAAGEAVTFVGVFDTVLRPRGGAPAFVFDVPRFMGFARYIEVYYNRSLDLSRDEVAAREGADRIAYFAERMRAAEVLPPDVDAAYVQKLFEIYVAHTSAYFHHVPSRFTSRTTLMRARTPLASELVYAQMPTASPTLGWSEYCVEPVTVIDVPGDHMTLLSPGPVREVAERLRVALDESAALSEMSEAVGRR